MPWDILFFLLLVHLMRSICWEGSMDSVTGAQSDMCVFWSEFLADEWQFDTVSALQFRVQEYMRYTVYIYIYCADYSWLI